jgi:uncharacterized repeat protein (TIGR03803 family)
MRSQKPFPTANMVFPIFLTLLLASIVVAAQTQATKFNVLHTFHGADGGSPMGVLVRDAAGNIYGTTVGGGTGKCSKLGCGTAFKLNRSGQQVWVHSFGGGDGYGPDAGLLRDAAGNLFGTTLDGGKVTKTCGGAQAGGCGVVFRLDRNGNETVLYKFKGTPDGDSPEALLVEDKAGNLYGTTYEGGAEGLGAVLKIDTNGKEIILHSFAGPPDGGGDGALSYQGVIRDAAGDLYGVTAGGGVYGAGVVYKVAGGKETSCTASPAARTAAVPTRFCSLMSTGTSTARPRTAAVAQYVTGAVARSSGCRPMAEAGRRRCSTASAQLTAVLTGRDR